MKLEKIIKITKCKDCPYCKSMYIYNKTKDRYEYRCKDYPSEYLKDIETIYENCLLEDAYDKDEGSER